MADDPHMALEPHMAEFAATNWEDPHTAKLPHMAEFPHTAEESADM